MSTFTRVKPCRKCGGHQFYIKSNRCLNCHKAYCSNNAEKLAAATKRWQDENREYLKVYYRARYELRKKDVAHE